MICFPSQKPCAAATDLSLHTQINFCAVNSSCGSWVGDSFAEIAVCTPARAQFCEGTIVELVLSGVNQLNLVQRPLGLSSFHIFILSSYLQDKNNPSFIRGVWFFLLMSVKSAFELYTKMIRKACKKGKGHLTKLFMKKPHCNIN